MFSTLIHFFHTSDLIKMVKLCVVGGCSNRDKEGYSLFCSQTNEKLSHKWDQFVTRNRLDWKTGSGAKHLPICALYFEMSCFSNHFAWQAELCFIYGSPQLPDSGKYPMKNTNLFLGHEIPYTFFNPPSNL